MILQEYQWWWWCVYRLCSWSKNWLRMGFPVGVWYSLVCWGLHACIIFSQQGVLKHCSFDAAAGSCLKTGSYFLLVLCSDCRFIMKKLKVMTREAGETWWDQPSSTESIRMWSRLHHSTLLDQLLITSHTVLHSMAEWCNSKNSFYESGHGAIIILGLPAWSDASHVRISCAWQIVLRGISF